ncbi:RRP15 [Candida oxycetoniae]|uniref:RRP15 n=1 Tax=Candida oxycetoniae TaxID=497107 RepID=A0AAI9SXA6_9ASCO|nr:RRP15 [Candida oxycetoniae]KAI3404505.1 RRP15 [Candida oxycetoniae]
MTSPTTKAKNKIQKSKSILKNKPKLDGNEKETTVKEKETIVKKKVVDKDGIVEEADNDLDQLSDLDDEDEVDIANESDEGDSLEEDIAESESGEGDSEDEELPSRKKQKKNKDDGSESFANAFNSIINSKLKAYDRKDPILARNKTTIKKLESEKLENKAKKALLVERKQFHDKHRVKHLLPVAAENGDSLNVRSTLEKEKQLKKLAQRGVVKLFNAILSTQIQTAQEVGKEKVGQAKREELMNDVSKEKFLDLIAAAGED